MLTQKREKTETSSIVVVVKAGAKHEPVKAAGISHFVEHMVFKGTKNIPDPTELSAVIENVGGFINASTDYDSTNYWIKIPQAHTSKGLDLLFDMLSNSLFESESIETERTVIAEEINSVSDFPDARCELNLQKIMWPGTYLERDIAGSKETLASITRSDLIQFSKNNHNCSKIIVSIAGNIDMESVTSAVAELSVKLPYLNEQNIVSSQNIKPESGQTHIEKTDTEQMHVFLGYPGASANDEAKYALCLINLILGSGMSSLLFREVREKRGLAYDIESRLYNLNDCGYLTISAGLSKDRLQESIKLIESVTSNCYQTIDAKALRKAKNMYEGKLTLSMEDNLSIAEFNATSQLFTGTEWGIQEHLEKINRVDLAKIKEIAKLYLSEPKPNVSIVGPVEE
ncbi:insulinase family protein [Dehalococcoidia bacterium]|nr:insulinase family protein [Dehalococcoidia bacterium]